MSDVIEKWSKELSELWPGSRINEPEREAIDGLLALATRQRKQLEIATKALKKNATPALGGKQQQADAREALYQITQMERVK